MSHDLAHLMNRRPGWHFIAKRMDTGAEHFADGFDSGDEAKQAAQDYALATYGQAPPHPVRLYVGRDDRICAAYMDWPSKG